MDKMKKITYLTVTGAAALSLTGCGKYEDGPSFSLLTKKSRVVGQWNVKSIGSEVLANNGGSINMDFERSGGMILSATYSYYGTNQTNSYAGSWDFASDKEQLMLNLDGDVQLFEIKRLTAKEMWLDDDITDLDGDIWKLEIE